MARAQFDEVEETLSASTGFGGTFTVSYPTGKEAIDYLQGAGAEHTLYSQAHKPLSAKDGEIILAFGASNITVTMNTDVIFSSGETVYLHLDRAEQDGSVTSEADALANADKMMALAVVEIDLGEPDTADADGIFTSYTGSTPALNGALVADGVATFDVPRNIVVDSGGVDTAVLTFTGTDEYGNTLVESITLNGSTAVAGKKAFKTVTAVSSSAAIANGAFAGTGDVLGLPVFVAEAGDVVYEKEDGATATAGTLVAGDTTTPTATTGDVRGTYDPNTAADGSTEFKIAVAVRSTAYAGADQYAG